MVELGLDRLAALAMQYSPGIQGDRALRRLSVTASTLSTAYQFLYPPSVPDNDKMVDVVTGL